MAQRGVQLLYLYPVFKLDARWGWVANAKHRLVHPRLSPGTHCPGGWVVARTGAENLPVSENRSPDPSANIKSLYRLSYPGVLSLQTLIPLNNVFRGAIRTRKTDVPAKMMQE